MAEGTAPVSPITGLSYHLTRNGEWVHEVMRRTPVLAKFRFEHVKLHERKVGSRRGGGA